MDPKQLRDRMRNRIPQSMAGGWYSIKNADDGDKAVIRIYDEISWFGITADDFARDLENVTAGELEVQINSPGGDVFDGLAIFNALRTHPARVTTRVDGIAASAASVIAQAGDHRVMVESAQMMIHEAWGIAIGPAADMREMAELLEKQNGVIAAIYAARSEKDADHFRQLMGTDTYLTDQETVDLGLADEVHVPPRKNAATKAEPQVNAQLRDELRGAFTDDDFRQELGLPPIQTPSAGQREEPTVPSEASAATVDHEQANRLLEALTITKEG